MPRSATRKKYPEPVDTKFSKFENDIKSTRLAEFYSHPKKGRGSTHWEIPVFPQFFSNFYVSPPGAQFRTARRVYTPSIYEPVDAVWCKIDVLHADSVD
jgi:hypothetical protein